MPMSLLKLIMNFNFRFTKLIDKKTKYLKGHDLIFSKTKKLKYINVKQDVF